MSIKDLFSNKSQKGGISSDSYYTASQDAESQDFIEAKSDEFDKFVPYIDYSTGSNFAKFGSAELYYESAFKRIYQEYPYDGTLRDKIAFETSASFLERWVFDNIYPRTNGYISMSVGGFGSSATGVRYAGHGRPSSKEYIWIQGGPHTASGGMASLASSFDNSMKYDLETKKGSSLAMDFESSGSTVEFWLKKDGFPSAATGQTREVIFEITNGRTPTAERGRMRLSLSASADDPMYLTLVSGSSAVDLSIGSNNLNNVIASGSWNHYAVTIKKKAAFDTRVKLYVNGDLDSEHTFPLDFGDITGSLNGAIGAISFAEPADSLEKGDGKLAASLDEFRYWKKERTPRQIKDRYFTQFGGGNNDYEDNSDLGVYYKFNEGIVGNDATDSSVLDYSGRIANGDWVGYSATSRFTGSAMVLSGKVKKEFKDPIIYSSHADVSSSMAQYKLSGSINDLENTSLFYNLMPSWMSEEDNESGENLKYLSQIMASYFDTLYSQISAMDTLKDKVYPSSSYKAIPFIDKLLKDKGFNLPNNFVDSNVFEMFLSKNDERAFDKDIDEVKKLIYYNIYNNLDYIYKSKGTEKSFRNLFRCFGIDSELIKLNLYAQDATYSFKENYEYTTVEKRYINLHHTGNFGVTIFQTRSLSDGGAPDANSKAFIYNNSDTLVSSSYTFETEIIVPKRLQPHEPGYFAIPFATSSIGGWHGVVAFNHYNSFPMTASGDYDARLYIVKTATPTRPAEDSSDGYFLLTGAFGKLTSSVYNDIYNNNKWNLAVRFVNDKYPYVDAYGVSGSAIANNWKLKFYGVNTAGNTVLNEFSLTASASRLYSLGNSAKQIYLGANRQNFTGTLLQHSDLKISTTRFWGSFLDDETIKLHAFDPLNYGVKRPYESDSMFQNLDGDGNQQTIHNFHLPQAETLALHWDFATVTGSDSGNKISVIDVTSGSTRLVDHYKALGEIIKRDYPGTSWGFPRTPNTTVSKEFVLAAKQRQPEIVYSSDMVTVKNNSNTHFFQDPDVTDNYYSFEKSMYSVISDEMLKMFATIVDFNNLIGEPVNKYRHNYKKLNILRHLFFEKVKNEPDFDKFLSFYKWVDAVISEGIKQLYPASARFSEKLSNVVESHILERNKYVHKFPLIARKQATEGVVKGINELTYDWRFGHAPGPVFFATFTADVDLRGVNAQRLKITNTDGTTVSWLLNASKTYTQSDADEIGTSMVSNATAPRSLWKAFDAAITAGTLKMSLSPAYVDVTTGTSLVLKQNIPGFGGRTLVIAPDEIHVNGGASGENSFFKAVGKPANNVNCLWQKDRKIRNDENRVDREAIRKVLNNENNNSSVNLVNDGVTYAGSTYALRRLAKPYKLSMKLDNAIHAGINFEPGKIRDYVFEATQVHGEQVGGVPQNVLSVGLDTGHGLKPSIDCLDSKGAEELIKVDSEAYTMKDTNVEYRGYTKGSLTLPMNIVSQSFSSYGNIQSGYSGIISRLFKKDINIVNLHHDSYTNQFDIGMQGPFTETHVGGHLHRHVRINTSEATTLDGRYTRPEAWKLIIDKGAGGTLKEDIDGAMGFVGPDYLESSTYPDSHKPLAIWYREEKAKRPLNVKNIKFGTSSAHVGNYRFNYEVIQTCGRSTNNFWLKNRMSSSTHNDGQQATAHDILPDALGSYKYAGGIYAPRLSHTTNPITLLGVHPDFSDTSSAGEVGNVFLSNNRVSQDARNRYRYGYVAASPNLTNFDYTAPERKSIGYNKTIIANKFSAPGGPEVMSKAYLDIYSEEYSVYNALPWRNYTVRFSGSGETNSMKLHDHLYDYWVLKGVGAGLGTAGFTGGRGLRTLLQGHCKWGGEDIESKIIDSSKRTDPGDRYIEQGSFHKINRNRGKRMVISGISSATSGSVTQISKDIIITGSMYDNGFVTHAIPRSEFQYSWIRNAISGSNWEQGQDLLGYAPQNGFLEKDVEVESYAFLNGINSRIEDPTSAAVWQTIIGTFDGMGNNIIGKFSVSVWVKALSDGGDNKGTIFALGDDLIWLRYNNAPGDLAFKFSISYNSKSTFSHVACADDDATLGVWHHIVITMDATARNAPEMYLNGVVNSPSGKTGTAGSGDSDEINGGLVVGNNAQGTHGWDGYIDNFMIFNRLLTIDEVEAIYNMGRGKGIGYTDVIKRKGKPILHYALGPTHSGLPKPTDDNNKQINDIAGHATQHDATSWGENQQVKSITIIRELDGISVPAITFPSGALRGV